MKSIEEINKAIHICITGECYKKCPYYNDGATAEECTSVLCGDIDKVFDKLKGESNDAANET